jgi:hypothetical protein
MHEYGYQMKGLGPGSKNMLFIFRIYCLFTFYKHKQLFVFNLLLTLGCLLFPSALVRVRSVTSLGRCEIGLFTSGTQWS